MQLHQQGQGVGTGQHGPSINGWEPNKYRSSEQPSRVTSAVGKGQPARLCEQAV